MIAITVDVDWAPDSVVEDTVELIEDAGVRMTLFATHANALVTNTKAHEIGVHPNFLPLPFKGCKKELDRLLALYPQSKGVRCHSYHQNSRILDLFVERGLIYDSNVVMFQCDRIELFRHWNGLIRVPVFWEDDVNCIAGESWVPTMPAVLDTDAVYVFNFHPVHVFLNTETLRRYESARPYYHNPAKLREFVNPEPSGTGTRVFLRRLLALIQAGHPATTVSEIVTAWSSRVAERNGRSL
jgi:polysaccharide deactylase WbmS-like protein